MVGINGIIKVVNDSRGMPGLEASNDLVTLPREQALALAADMPSQELAHTLSSLSKPSDLAQMVSLVPAEKMPAVLMSDDRVFANARSWGEFPDSYDDPQGPVERLTRKEYDALSKVEAHKAWLVPIEHTSLGEPVVWGLRFSLVKISDSEAFERLEAILESDNDDEWRAIALRALPSTYVALALKYVKKEDERQADRLLERIHAIMDGDINDEGTARDIEALLSVDDQTLHRQLVEAREAIITDTKITIELTGKAAEVKEQMSQRERVEDLLEQFRE